MSKKLALLSCLGFWLLLSPGIAPALPPADIAVGYLVDQDFGINQDQRLSDWDVDSRGATVVDNYWAYFVIAGTGSTTAFEMRKSFLPQSSGTIAVEFRFSPQVQIDGMTWAVRADRDQSLVEITTRGGVLGYLNSNNGTFVPLQSYSTASTYTVHVDLNVPGATGTISVNGVVKASGVIGRNTNLTQASQFYVSTPTTTTGNLMYLYYVTITKGYKLLERFTNAAAGAVPANWTASGSGGSATVQAAYGSNVKDTLSFRLQDTSTANACTLGRSFAASTSKLVWEYKFRLSGKQAGVKMQLRAGSTNAVTITTTATDLAYVDNAGNSVPIWANYLDEFWYTIRVVADPTAGTADLYVNGKRMATNAPFNTAASSFDNVLFSTTTTGMGTLWIDDVLVYDQPADPPDYVPAIRTVTGQTKKVGMQTFFAGWHEGHHQGWDWVARFPNHDPVLGFYDSSNPEAMDWQLKWMAESGVTFFLDCWYKNPISAMNPVSPTKEPLFEYTQGPLHTGYFYARYSDQVKFAIADYTLNGTSAADFEQYILPYWIEYYFKDPRYYMVPGTKKGSPVISFGAAVDPKTNIVDAALKDMITKLRAALVAQGFDNPVVLAEYRYAKESVLTNLKSAGVDYVYAYWGENVVSGTQNSDGSTQSRLQDQLNAGTGPTPPLVKSLPDGGQGYSGEAWNLSLAHAGYTPVADFASNSTWMQTKFPTLAGVSGLGLDTILYDNWCEFGEGHFIAPTALNLGSNNPNGFAYLNVIRDTFTTSNLSNAIPTAAQITRLNTLYAHGWQGRYWSFDAFSTDTEGWTVGYGITNLVTNKGYLEGKFTTADPSLLSRDGYRIDASIYNQFKVRMKNSGSGTAAKLYFTTNTDGTFDENKSIVLPITPGADYTEYVADLSVVSGWAGTIRQLRFDPVDTGAVMDQTFSIDYIKIVAPVNKGWEFNGTTTEGWTGAQINGLQVTGGNLQGSLAGSDPRIYSLDGIELNAAAYRQIKVRMRNSTGDSSAKLYFITSTDPTYNEAKSKSISINANDPNYYEYSFDMSAVTGWSGTVRQLRLDVVDGTQTTGSFYVDYIRLVSPGSQLSAAPASFNAWQTANFTAAQGQSANVADPGAMPAGDGIANTLKYLFGLKPLTVSSLPITSGFEMVNGSKRYVYKFRLPYTVPADVALRLQVSGEMQTWSQAAYRPVRGCWQWDTNKILTVTESDVETGVEIKIITTINSSTDRAAFLRLQASLE